jgi:hypothetical protein
MWSFLLWSIVCCFVFVLFAHHMLIQPTTLLCLQPLAVSSFQTSSSSCEPNFLSSFITTLDSLLLALFWFLPARFQGGLAVLGVHLDQAFSSSVAANLTMGGGMGRAA